MVLAGWGCGEGVQHVRTTCAWHAKVLGWIPVPLPPVTTVTMESLEWYGRTNDNLLNSNMNFLFLPINTLK